MSNFPSYFSGGLTVRRCGFEREGQVRLRRNFSIDKVIHNGVSLNIVFGIHFIKWKSPPANVRLEERCQEAAAVFRILCKETDRRKYENSKTEYLYL